MFTRILCQEVADAGVNLQEIMTYRDAYSVLSFVPGLGVRKARKMVEKLMENGTQITNRDDFKTLLELGDEVFKNCNGFLRRQCDE